MEIECTFSNTVETALEVNVPNIGSLKVSRMEETDGVIIGFSADLRYARIKPASGRPHTKLISLDKILIKPTDVEKMTEPRGIFVLEEAESGLPYHTSILAVSAKLLYRGGSVNRNVILTDDGKLHAFDTNTHWREEGESNATQLRARIAQLELANRQYEGDLIARGAELKKALEHIESLEESNG